MKNKRNKPIANLSAVLAAAAGTLALLFTSSVGFAQGGLSVQRFGLITLSAQQQDLREGPDGREHFIMSGNPVLMAEVRTVNGTMDRYEIRAARSIDYTLAAGGGAIANAVAVGAVHIEVHSPLLPQAGGGERILIVTGDRAFFNNQPQGGAETADVIGNPHLTLYDPQLASPAVLSNAVSIHVNLLTREFHILGDATHRPTITVEPKGAPPKTRTGHARSAPTRQLQMAAVPVSRLERTAPDKNGASR